MRRASQLPPGGATKRDDWTTPDWLFRQLDQEFGPFTLDAAASAGNAKCARYFDAGCDGLAQPWSGRVFLNPPYRDVGAWAAKALLETRAGRAGVVVALLPARTGTGWFHRCVLGRADVRFLRGRIRFGGGAPSARDAAPFDSMVAIWRAEARP